MKTRLIVLAIALLIALPLIGLRDSLHFVDGTNADGSGNVSFYVGGDDCYFQAQTGGYTGFSAACGPVNISAFYVAPVAPEEQKPLSPRYPTGGEL